MLLSTSATPGTGSPLRFRSRPSPARGLLVTSEHMSLTASGERLSSGATAPSYGSAAQTGATGTWSAPACHNPHGNGNYRILNPMPLADFRGGLSGRLQWTRGTRHRGHRRRPAAGRLGPELHRPARGARRRCHRGRHRRGLLAALSWTGRTAAARTGATSRTAWRRSASRSRPGAAPVTPAISPATAARRTRGNRIPMPSSPTGIPPTRRPSAPSATSHWVERADDRASTYGNSPTPRATLHPNATSNSGDSRLLKVDGRGTCQLCHDPTGTVTNVGVVDTPNPAP